MQANVAKQLRRLFPELKIEEEYEDPKSGFSIDIWAEMGGPRNESDTGSGAGRVWAVEVDGPSHFLKVRGPNQTNSMLDRRIEIRLCGAWR